MSKQIFRLVHATARQRAMKAVADAPEGYEVRVQEAKRTLDQNAKFHAICGELEKLKVEFLGKPRTLDKWKQILVSAHAEATKDENNGYVGYELCMGLEGEIFTLRESTADMVKSRKSSLIAYSEAFLSNVIAERFDERVQEKT